MKHLALVVLLVVVVGCRTKRARDRCTPRKAGDIVECRIPQWPERSVELRVPASWDGQSKLPVAFLLHGGGGNRGNADKTTCPDGNTSSPACFAAIAASRGYAVVIPDGTGARALPRARTWNGGGGGRGPEGARDCVSGRACADNIDDVQYFRDALGEIERIIPIDQRRVFATGLSNGGAMSHRLACELGDRFAAVVSVGGGNQHAFVGGTCAGGAAVMELHGTRDVCWPYAGGGGDCISNEYKVGVDAAMTAWAGRNGCSDRVIEEPLSDRDPTDGVTSTRRRWVGCTRATEILRSDGAGHTWPNGHAYSARAGIATRDFGSEVIVDFFDANPRR